MITIENLHKSFGKNNVLRGVSFQVRNHKITAVLGPNGSGKTTLIKAIAGLVIPDSGKIYIDGKDILKSWKYKQMIGYMPQIANFPDNLSANELFSMIKDIRKQKGNPEPYIRMFNIQEEISKPLKALSGGTKQKVNIALAMMFNTPILLFDEPTAGLDPVARMQFKDFIKKEKDHKTLLITTHIMSEVEELADEIIFILDGKIFFQGTVEQLKFMQGTSSLEQAIAGILQRQNQPANFISNPSIRVVNG